jgi:CheY-like chemotaxis protein
LLLTDYMMPGMTGGELAGRARALDPQLPIVVASGFADAATPIRADLPRLAKPYGLNELSAALTAIGLIDSSG